MNLPYPRPLTYANLYPHVSTKSKECQKEAWKSRHKRTCQSHVLNKKVMNSDTTQNPRREKLLSSWLNVWRGLFEVFALMALDLANHKGQERTKSHW